MISPKQNVQNADFTQGNKIPTSNTATATDNTAKTPESTKTTENTKVVGNLHQGAEAPISPSMEQIRRLQELRETLMSGDTDKNKKNDAIALDLVEVIKSNLYPDSPRLEEHTEMLNDLSVLIVDKKFSEANTKITEIAKSLEEDITARNFKPKKNLEGGAFATIIDTAIQHILGNIAGPVTVKFVEKTLGIPIKKANLGDKEVHAEVGAGVTGFQAAEMLIGGHFLGIPLKIPGWNGIDPIFENMSKKLNKWIETKNPNFKINFNASADKMVKKAVNAVLNIFGKNSNAKVIEGTERYDTELQNEVDEYIKNRHQIEHQDPEARVKLVKKMVNADFENSTGKKIQGPLKLAMDFAFKTTDNGHPSKHSLLMNELALAVKPYLDKLGPPGKLVYNFLYYVAPNQYIFGFRPVGQYMINDKEKYLVDRANDIKHSIEKPLEAAAAH